MSCDSTHTGFIIADTDDNSVLITSGNFQNYEDFTSLVKEIAEERKKENFYRDNYHPAEYLFFPKFARNEKKEREDHSLPTPTKEKNFACEISVEKLALIVTGLADLVTNFPSEGNPLYKEHMDRIITILNQQILKKSPVIYILT